MSEPRKLWKHQMEAVERANSLDNFGLFFQPGAGKSAACIHMIRAKSNAKKRLLKTIIICPPIVIDNWKHEFSINSKIAPSSITCLTGSGKRRRELFLERKENPHIFITNYETMQMDVFQDFLEWKPEIVVFDECFRGLTPVTTLRGELPIKDVVEGDYVLNCLGWSKVKSVIPKKVSGRIELQFNGRMVVCSTEHPFFTNLGWVKAKELIPGRHFLVTTESSMRLLRGDFSEKVLARDLFKELWDEVEGKIPGVSGLHSESEPNEIEESSPESERNFKAYWAQAKGSWWKWPWGHEARKNSFRFFIEKTFQKVGWKLYPFKWETFEKIEAAPTLQNRLSTSFRKACRGSRWLFPLRFKKAGARSEERNFLNFVRLESSTFHQSTSGDGFENDLFYDLEVAGHPSFTVNGVLVHNCHRLSNYSSKRSKLAEKLVNGNMVYDKKTQTYSGERPYVYILSGSPILNSPMDIFQQYKILDAGKTFGTNFFGFRGRYFIDKNAGMPRHIYFPNWVVRPDALDQIGEMLNTNSMRVLKKDCLDLPPLIRQTIKVEMAPEQKKLYESMLEEYVAYFTKNEKEEVTSATMGLTKSLRLMQIASGYIKTVEGKELDICSGYNPKQDALYELLKDITPNHKVLIWAVWIQNYEQIRQVLKDLKLDWLEINGQQGAAKNRANAKEFEENKNIRCLIAHPKSGGEGINLVSASYAITYSRSYSLMEDIQAEARNYRGGSELHEKITRIDLVSKGTIEEKVLEVLANKQEVGEKMLREITLQIIKGEKS